MRYVTVNGQVREIIDADGQVTPDAVTCQREPDCAAVATVITGEGVPVCKDHS